METVRLESTAREKENKGRLKEKRQKGLVPGVIYGLSAETKSIYLEANSLKKALQTSAGSNVLIELDIKGDKQKKEIVMIKDLQRDLLNKDELLHVDLFRISLKEKIEVNVPLDFVGEPEGVKDGGILEVQLREVAVRCLPTEIPEKLEINIDNLTLGHALSVADLEIPEGVELLEDPEENIVSIQTPDIVEEVEEEAEEGEELLEEGEEVPEGDEESPQGEKEEE